MNRFMQVVTAKTPLYLPPERGRVAIGAIERRLELRVGSLQDPDGAHQLLAEIRLYL